jgi:hypothetical protein
VSVQAIYACRCDGPGACRCKPANAGRCALRRRRRRAAWRTRASMPSSRRSRKLAKRFSPRVFRPRVLDASNHPDCFEPEAQAVARQRLHARETSEHERRRFPGMRVATATPHAVGQSLGGPGCSPAYRHQCDRTDACRCKGAIACRCDWPDACRCKGSNACWCKPSNAGRCDWPGACRCKGSNACRCKPSNACRWAYRSRVRRCRAESRRVDREW